VTTPRAGARAGSRPLRPRRWPPTQRRGSTPTAGVRLEGSPLPLQQHAGHAALVYPLHDDLIAIERQLVAGAGHAPQHRVDEPTHRRDLRMLERAPERLGQVVEPDAAVDPVAVAVLRGRRGLD